MLYTNAKIGNLLAIVAAAVCHVGFFTLALG